MKLINRIKKVINNPYSLFLHLDYLQLIRWLPAGIYERIKYRTLTGERLNLKNPQTFSDKQIWMKLHWRDNTARLCADKLLVRDYIREKGLSEILNNIYAVYDNVAKVDLEKLPDRFIFKVTNGSGWNVICMDKNKMDWDLEFKKLSEWLKKDYYHDNREWIYKGSKNVLICEELLQDSEGRLPNDYKFMCFNGEPKFIQVDVGRFDNHTRSYFDENWNILDVTFKFPNRFTNPPLKPQNFDRMMEIARILSKDFNFARIDLYNVDGMIYFGEITFFHQAGYSYFSPKEFNQYIGDMLTLPVQK